MREKTAKKRAPERKGCEEECTFKATLSEKAAEEKALPKATTSEKIVKKSTVKSNLNCAREDCKVVHTGSSLYQALPPSHAELSSGPSSDGR